MVGGTIHREMIHGEISRVLVLHPALATTRCASAERAELRLDNAFVLIEATPELELPNASHGCGLYLQPVQYGCGLYSEPVQRLIEMLK
jgi:hypothetical protein